ncbi:uncharacterized protein LOC110872619 isoform X4 [Helianthus annuus]|uniref:uncharacterized protein LOC110872619 isoform X4 n=1 Tax=Helianthus annuus TaxID=4232 RepID=UPI000B907F80|nr:uncharacterized protein LOC110872619 isoform X4 [Helianthus annuus]
MITVWRNLREGGTLLGLPLTVWRIWNWIFCGSTGYWASGYVLSLLELTFLQRGYVLVVKEGNAGLSCAIAEIMYRQSVIMAQQRQRPPQVPEFRLPQEWTY